MLTDVGQRLLDDPVRGQVGGDRAERAGPSTRSSMGSPERRNEATSAPTPDIPRAGPVGAAPSPAQQPDRVPELTQRRLARRTNVGQRLTGLPRLRVEDMGGHPGLHADQRQVVADQVVQVTGDAQPLLGDPARRLDVPVGLGPPARASASARYARRLREASPAATASPPSAASVRLSAPSHAEAWSGCG